VPKPAAVELIVAERRKAGLRQADVAKKLGEYQSWVSRLESGTRGVDVTEFLNLAQAIGFDAGAAIRRLDRARRRKAG
jgi:transcriptional regulator with XRE-family HTH domain